MKKLKKDVPLATFGIWQVYSDGMIRGRQKLPNGNLIDVEFDKDKICKKDFFINVVYDELITDLGSFTHALYFTYNLLNIKEVVNKTVFD